VVQCAFSCAALCESLLMQGIGAVESRAVAAMPRVRGAGRAAHAHAAALALHMQQQLDTHGSRGATWLTQMLEVQSDATSCSLNAACARTDIAVALLATGAGA
jgi:hypothetical protein